MTLAAFADIAEIVGAFGVIAGLIFVGFQLRQNTIQMRRSEAHMAMEQGSGIRQLLLNNREAAEVIFAGLSGAPLDPVNELRVNALFSEVVYLALHTWDRMRNGLTAPDELSRGVIPTITPVMTSARGLKWWASSRSAFLPDFVTDFEALLPRLKPADSAPSAKAVEPAETAVAPPADAG